MAKQKPPAKWRVVEASDELSDLVFEFTQLARQWRTNYDSWNAVSATIAIIKKRMGYDNARGYQAAFDAANEYGDSFFDKVFTEPIAMYNKIVSMMLPKTVYKHNDHDVEIWAKNKEIHVNGAVYYQVGEDRIDFRDA